MVQTKKLIEFITECYDCDFCGKKIHDGAQLSSPGPRHGFLYQCKLCDKDICLKCQHEHYDDVIWSNWGLLCYECSETHKFNTQGEIVEFEESSI